MIEVEVIKIITEIQTLYAYLIYTYLSFGFVLLKLSSFAYERNYFTKLIMFVCSFPVSFQMIPPQEIPSVRIFIFVADGFCSVNVSFTSCHY